MYNSESFHLDINILRQKRPVVAMTSRVKAKMEPGFDHKHYSANVKSI